MVTLFVESVICVILGYGGYLVYCGSFDAGQLVEYIGYFLGRCMADHGGLHADREDIPWKSVLKPYYGTA